MDLKTLLASLAAQGIQQIPILHFNAATGSVDAIVITDAATVLGEFAPETTAAPVGQKPPATGDPVAIAAAAARAAPAKE